MMRNRGGGGNRGRTKPSRPKLVRKKSKSDDPFFEPDAKKRRKSDEVIESDDSDDGDLYASGGEGQEASEEEERDAVEETAAEKRHRIANAQLEKIRALTKKYEEEGEGEEGSEDDEDRAGKRDALVADILLKDQLQKSGRVRRMLASRILKPEADDGFRILHKHRQSVTAVALSGDDSRGFSASKDGAIVHWDVESGVKEKYLWSTDVKGSKGSPKKHSKQVLAIAVSSDGRYLATGGSDRLVHLWDTRTRQHLQAFQGHKAPVSCLTFRDGTPDLFSGSFDHTIKWWNAADRTHQDNFFGHEAEVLTIDCLRKERVLSVGRDRTLRMFKVIEAVSLRYSAPSSSLECCCFINNEEFLSGSDDGSIGLWSMLRKKPTFIVKNAHTVSILPDVVHGNGNDRLTNGFESGSVSQKPENCSLAQSWVSSVTVCKGSDLAASGAGNGIARLWAIESDTRSIKPLYDLPLAGFVNSLALAKSGRFLLAGVGQEPRLGRWGRIQDAKNGVALYRLRFSGEMLQF